MFGNKQLKITGKIGRKLIFKIDCQYAIWYNIGNGGTYIMTSKPYGFIYITTNKINGRKYIGQKNYDKHGKWKNYLGSGRAFLEAVNLYGKDNFEKEVIAIAYNPDELNELENHYINKYDAVNDKLYYNIVEGGGTVTGLKHSEYTKKLLSAKFSGKNNYFYGKRYIGKDNPFYNKNHSEESRAKMSESHIGKIPWCKGKKGIFSDETLKRMSEAKKGIPLSMEHKKNIRLSQSGEKHPMFGKKHTEETKEKIRQKALGKKATAETKAKMSEAQKGEKNHNYGKKGSQWHGAKEVICITTNKTFGSIIEAAEHYNCNKSDITQCCKKKRKSAGKLPDGTKLIWEYQS